MKTVFGIFASQDGLAWTQELEQGALRPELRFKAWSSPASEYRTVQPARVIVDQEHDGVPVGEVVHLEHGPGGNAWCVAHVDDAIVPEVRVKLGPGNVVSVPHDLYWSAQRRETPGGLELMAMSLTTSPARLGARTQPVVFLPGQLDHRSAWKRWNLQYGYRRDLLERAANGYWERRFAGGGPIVVHHRDDAQPPALELRRTSRVEIRHATAVDVHRARRELDVVIAPAETPTEIQEPGRRYTEVMSHGAFAGCEHEPGKVKVNMHHQRQLLIGKAVSLDPWAEEGLVGTLRLSKTRDADDALMLIEDDLLGISAGFMIPSGGEEWRGTTHRRVRKAELRHVALVDEAAYPSARITAVRGRELLVR